MSHFKQLDLSISTQPGFNPWKLFGTCDESITVMQAFMQVLQFPLLITI